LKTLSQAARVVLLLNLAYFFVEFAVAVSIGSVSLFADSVDFLEDASINLLILIGLGWSTRARARLGMLLAVILLVPGLAALWTGYQKILHPIPPSVIPLSAAGAGAFLVNLTCAFILARFRRHSGSLTRAAYLSARNDVLANIAIILAGGVTAFYPTAWPDLVVGLGIAVMNLDAAREVYQEAREEHASGGDDLAGREARP
jgi:Co/Zn/Cd efflux system component